MSKVTMQDIANALGVSRVTVWKAFRRADHVSDELRRRIIDKALEMGYQKIPVPAASDLSASSGKKTVSVIVSRPESSVFWMNIIHHIARELSAEDTGMMYCYAPVRFRDDYHLPEELSDGTVQGVIALNIYDEKLISCIGALPVPKVFLDTVAQMPVSGLQGDLVLLEGEESVEILTNHLIAKGAHRIGFIGDIGYARTNFERYRGFQTAMQKANLTVDETLCLTSHIPIHDYASLIHSFLHGLKSLPDAFVCVSDYVASFVYHYMEQTGINIPGDILITGFDRSDEYANVAGILTSVDVNTSYIGTRLTQALLNRIHHPDNPPETIYLRTTPVFGFSTGD